MTDDGSCEVGGCTADNAVNFDPNAAFDDASCRFMATFEVDMSGVSDFDRADGVYIHGTFTDWCGTCAVLTDGDADGVYRGTVAVTVGAHEYRFVIGSDPIREEIVLDSCDVIEDPTERARGLVMPERQHHIRRPHLRRLRSGARRAPPRR